MTLTLSTEKKMSPWKTWLIKIVWTTFEWLNSSEFSSILTHKSLPWEKLNPSVNHVTNRFNQSGMHRRSMSSDFNFFILDPRLIQPISLHFSHTFPCGNLKCSYRKTRIKHVWCRSISLSELKKKRSERKSCMEPVSHFLDAWPVCVWINKSTHSSEFGLRLTVQSV